MQPETTTDIEAQQEQTLAIIERVEELRLATPFEYTNASGFLAEVAKRKRAVAAAEKAATDPIKKELDEARQPFKVQRDALEQADTLLRTAINDYNREQRREAARREAEARERAEAERRRLAERARKAAEKGQEIKAATLEQQAETLPAPIVPPSTPKVQGQYFVKVWKWEVEDKAKLPGAYLVVDEKAIGALVKAQGERAAETIPGIRVWQEEEVRRRTT